MQYLLSVRTSIIGSREVPVRFNQTTYSVVEGEKSVSITLEALAEHTFSFSVTVSTRDGTAGCECQAVVYGQTCLPMFLISLLTRSNEWIV